jgi:hypothetical protein
MKYREYRPNVKFDLKYLLIRKLNQKARGHVLMTQFDKSKKIKLSGLLSRNIRFQQFHSKAKEEVKLEDLKSQCVLK